MAYPTFRLSNNILRADNTCEDCADKFNNKPEKRKEMLVKARAKFKEQRAVKLKETFKVIYCYEECNDTNCCLSQI
jgi:hypothetical protein